MPNDQIQPDMPLTAFAVPLEMLENVAGIAPEMLLSAAQCAGQYMTSLQEGQSC